MSQAQLDDLDTPQKRITHPIAIIGCGPTAVAQAILFAEAGFKVTCSDTDQTGINRINKGKTGFLSVEITKRLKALLKTKRLSATVDVQDSVSKADIIMITTPVRINSKKRAEYAEIENVCKKIGRSLQKDSIVIVNSIIGIGINETLVKETLENTSGLRAGTDFGLAYGPIHAFDSRTMEEIRDHERILAALDKGSLKTASAVLETICKKGIKRTTSVKTAEVASLVETLRHDAYVALANEATVLFEKTRVDCLQAQRLMQNEVYGLAEISRFADDSFSDEPYLLLNDEENLNLKPRFALAVRETNEESIRHLMSLVKDALSQCGKNLKRAKISILGVTSMPNTQGLPKKTVEKLIESLEARGAKTSVYDPYLTDNEIDDAAIHSKKNLTETLERADCIVIMTGHEQFTRLNFRKMKLTMKMPVAIVDLEGIIDASKVEKEGIVYRGLGRGVWTG
jgi:nucleotide sugar dehydrogenase